MRTLPLAIHRHDRRQGGRRRRRQGHPRPQERRARQARAPSRGAQQGARAGGARARARARAGRGTRNPRSGRAQVGQRNHRRGYRPRRSRAASRAPGEPRPRPPRSNQSQPHRSTPSSFFQSPVRIGLTAAKRERDSPLTLSPPASSPQTQPAQPKQSLGKIPAPAPRGAVPKPGSKANRRRRRGLPRGIHPAGAVRPRRVSRR